MTRIVIKPAWILSTDRGDHFEPQLFRLLRAIHETGKLRLAVKTIGLSYRHAWDLLARWSDIFGGDLVSMHRGKGATLTKVGEKLLWAEERTEAGLFPQLANIASEVNVEIRRAQKGATPVLRLHASHGYAVQKLPELVRRHGSSVIDLKYMGSAEALASLHRGACDAAGFHLPLGPLGPVMWSDYARWVRPQQQRIIRLVTRTQGLIVAKGNPLGIATLHDLARPRVRFVHRQAGSGRARSSTRCCTPARSIPRVSRGSAPASSRTRPWPPSWRAAWRTPRSASSPRRVNSSSISSRW